MGADYEKNLFKQFEEAMKNVDFLMAENKALKKEIAEMKKTHKSEIGILNSKIVSLESENKKLKNQIDKNSGNSGKPPSSDGFKKIPNSRAKTGKSVGGQKGHKSNVPKLISNPTEIVNHKQEICSCGGHFKYENETYKAKQQVDIRVETIVIEHRVHQGVCENCKCKSNNKFPKGVTSVFTYGDYLKSYVCMLLNEGMVSISRTKQLLSEMTEGKINLSDGTLVNFNKELSQKLMPAVEHIKDRLLISPVNHKDETSIRIDKSLFWLHVLSNETYTLYESHAKRGNVADIAMGLLESYGGVLVHDHLKGLYKFNCAHAECNAHILRYLKAAIQEHKRNWAQLLIAMLLEAHKEIKNAKVQGETALPASRIKYYFEKYDQILLLGQKEFNDDPNSHKDYSADDMRLLRRLKQYEKEHLRFITNFKVPFDNNLAERDLRMIKTKAKVSGCFRSETGGQHFATIKSYLSTLRKSGVNLYEGLRSAFNNNPILA